MTIAPSHAKLCRLRAPVLCSSFCIAINFLIYQKKGDYDGESKTKNCGPKVCELLCPRGQGNYNYIQVKIIIRNIEQIVKICAKPSVK